MSDDLTQVDAWWRAANYLSAAQIYLLDNPLLQEPLRADHIKPRLLGHWGTSPGLNFVYAHLNRAIRARDLDMIFIAGPGHGGPAVLANAWLEGTYGEVYPEAGHGAEEIRRFVKQFSFPGGVPSHAAPETPGSIHEGGELGYSLMHAHGAAFDNPDLHVACVIGDGEAEAGPLAASWPSIRFVDAARDGAVLPILHLNGYRIAGPTVMGRMDDAALDALFRGHGYAPLFVCGDEPARMHRDMAAALDAAFDSIAAIQRAARDGTATPAETPRWPLIVLRSPKGWTGPERVDGAPVEGTHRAHQIPLPGVKDDPDHLRQLEAWLKSYRPDELFRDGAPAEALRAIAPEGVRRMSANPAANGGRLLRPLDLPALAPAEVEVPAPGAVQASANKALGAWLREVMRANPDNFRLFGPDETESNKLDAVFDVTGRKATGEVRDDDADLAPDGRVMEVLSEHLCQGWLEGYLLTGRHGLFNSYEAFVHIAASMFNQHAKWLRVSGGLAWRAPVASLNYLLTSHVWRQDHNGFSHQDPGFLDHVASKGAEVVRIYLPPDANCLLQVARACLESRDRVNVIVSGKHEESQWLSPEAARAHCEAGLGAWDWASDEVPPDVVMACAGDVPTQETLAAVALLREHLPDLALRVVNVVDLMALQPPPRNADGLDDAGFDALFTTDKPVIFAFHGYPGLIHELTYRRRNHHNFHVHGYSESGTTTTPADMAVRNALDRFHLVLAALRRSGRDDPAAEALAAHCRDRLEAHHDHVRATGTDLPEIRDWRWPG
ncbi:putative phosphoketolase [Oceanicola granulosus HTCC2516]|uniref:Putative phosphoketolase n=1 Tax=Oceanicola granulosus (strain ATCC BAA-861 / DSM 15982 / KCTC 12143 / HTCC2516) TaxID=314256 RepID=Q2CEM2_OCEGH|nr:phosphoketolase family protein [Oceanicola granulosus]EAR51110.1 putative phosphoketolase [Oceanicola granulosus HTCC2516]